MLARSGRLLIGRSLAGAIAGTTAIGARTSVSMAVSITASVMWVAATREDIGTEMHSTTTAP